ncbi:hypothetical protein [Deinococcus sp.]|uniref:hypothetical protein n=1 Tax=Deinococcus sp. TaxID=47478 RepID=UPI003B58E3B5
MSLDEMTKQAIEDIRHLPKVTLTPCSLLTSERDYRYNFCFVDDSGSTAETVKGMRQAMEKAGFQSASQGSDSSELDTSYRVPGEPYSVKITFSGFDFDWIVWQDKLGYVAPRPGLDDGANYALLDPAEMARQVLLELVLNSGGYGLINGQVILEACGESNEKQASACTNVDFTVEKGKKALYERFFSGERAWFDPLDAKPTFEYRQEPLFAEMLAEGSRVTGDPPSPLLVKKESEGVYFITHNSYWPAYEFHFYIPTQGSGPLKVTATRRKAPPSSEYPAKP